MAAAVAQSVAPSKVAAPGIFFTRSDGPGPARWFGQQPAVAALAVDKGLGWTGLLALRGSVAKPPVAPPAPPALPWMVSFRPGSWPDPSQQGRSSLWIFDRWWCFLSSLHQPRPSSIAESVTSIYGDGFSTTMAMDYCTYEYGW